MAERSSDWLRQAHSDLNHARHASDDGDYDWAAFASHQAAEKAIKALFQKLHLDAWGHVLSMLLANLPDDAEPGPALIDRAKELDKHYIPTRYPNGFERERRRISTRVAKRRKPLGMQRPSSSSVTIKSIDKARIRASMDAFARSLLSSNEAVQEIVVFGSFENDTYAPGSDLDVFILLSYSDMPARERIPELLPLAFPVAMDLFPYTQDEIEALQPSPILAAVADSGWRYRR